MITGKKITLKPFDAEDSERLREWANLHEICFSADFSYPINELEHQHWYEKISADRTKLFFSFYNGSEHKGCVWLEYIDYVNSKARVYSVSSQKESLASEEWSEAIYLITKYAFSKLNLNKIYCEIPAGNTFLKSIFERGGLKQEAILIEEFFKNGTYENAIRFSAIRSKPASQQNAQQSTPDTKHEVPRVQWFQTTKNLRNDK